MTDTTYRADLTAKLEQIEREIESHALMLLDYRSVPKAQT